MAQGLSQGKAGREERSGCSSMACIVPSAPILKGHPELQLAPRQGPMYLNHTGDPSIPCMGTPGRGTGLKPFVCQRVVFPGWTLNPGFKAAP